MSVLSVSLIGRTGPSKRHPVYSVAYPDRPGRPYQVIPSLKQVTYVAEVVGADGVRARRTLAEQDPGVRRKLIQAARDWENGLNDIV